ncbi:MAG: ribosome-interacting GTPase 1 [Pirellulaceae bacterium]|jgi:ribosome-interacting GTPase 1
MPANLTIKYHKAEQAYRQATSPEEELRCLQVMLRDLPKHKGTDKLQANLKQKISRLKKEMEAAQSSKTGPSKTGPSKKIPRQGAGRVIIIGGPNAGKSQLLASMTRATPEIAPYPYSTREPNVGMMPWEDVSIQLIDTPPITADIMDPNTQGLIRGSDLVLLVADLGADEGIDQLQELLARLANTKTSLATETYLSPTDVGCSFTKTFFVANKCDLPDSIDRLALLHEYCEIEFDEFIVSAQQQVNLDSLRAAIFGGLDVVRVYTKLPNEKEPDYEKPFTLKRGGTLQDVAELIHKDIADNLKGARVWGETVHDGAMVRADYELSDKDVVEIHT